MLLDKPTLDADEEHQEEGAEEVHEPEEDRNILGEVQTESSAEVLEGMESDDALNEDDADVKN